MEMSDISFGRRVALARQRRGLSRRALGDLVGRSAEWVRQVERGDRDVDRLSVLRQLAEVLRIGDLPAFLDCAVPSPRRPPPDPTLPGVSALRDAVYARPPATGD